MVSHEMSQFRESCRKLVENRDLESLVDQCIQKISEGADPGSLLRGVAQMFGALGANQDCFDFLVLLSRPASKSRHVLVAIAETCIQIGQPQAAADICDVVLRADSTNGPALFTKGLAEKELARPFDAAPLLEAALASDQGNTGAIVTLASVYKDMMRQDEAIALLLELEQSGRSTAPSRSNLIGLLNYHDAEDPAHLRQRLEYFYGSVKEYARVERSVIAKNGGRRKLRVGFLSGDFALHPVGLFFKDFFRHFSDERVESYLFYNAARSDDITRELQGRANDFFNISALADAEVAEKISDAKIDILIDLSGHTRGSRLGVLRQRPAKIQGSWLGYCGTTGIPEVDFIIGDKFVIPRENEHHFTEHVVRMPGCYLAADAATMSSTHTLPAKRRSDSFLFASFHNINKLNSKIISIWAEILKRTPTSKIVLKTASFHSVKSKEAVLKSFASYGVEADRVLCVPHLTRNEHFNFIRTVDLVLDAYPYNGVTSTFEAIASGIPVLTLVGDRFVSRNGLSILTNAGLGELVCFSSQEYEEKAVNFFSDKNFSNELYAKTSRAVHDSRIFDSRLFAHSAIRILRRLAN
jgi:predicted O-linked N-acetylglucosamine transferase (SPINDLY family)